MLKTVNGIDFEAKSDPGGINGFTVVKRAGDSLAVEFILEAVDGGWASDVFALRSGVFVSTPSSKGISEFRLRLFDEFGKEINKKSLDLLRVDGGTPLATGVKVEKAGGKFGLFVIFLLALGAGSLFLGSGLFGNSLISSPALETVPSTSVDSDLRIAVVARSANFRSSPEVRKGNIISTLPFGVQLLSSNVHGSFFEARTSDGLKGYIHRDVVAEASKVQSLNFEAPMLLAKATTDVRRELILTAAREVRSELMSVSLLDDGKWSRIEPLFKSAVGRTSGDNVTGRFFHYLAEEAAARDKLSDALVYFRAAALSDPLSVVDVHGSGVTQLRTSGTVDESSVFHAVVVAPLSTNTWVMVAGHIAAQPNLMHNSEVVSALRLAVRLSSDPNVTKRFFSDLSRSTSNELLKSSLIEVVASM